MVTKFSSHLEVSVGAIQFTTTVDSHFAFNNVNFGSKNLNEQFKRVKLKSWKAMYKATLRVFEGTISLCLQICDVIVAIPTLCFVIYSEWLKLQWTLSSHQRFFKKGYSLYNSSDILQFRLVSSRYTERK